MKSEFSFKFQTCIEGGFCAGLVFVSSVGGSRGSVFYVSSEQKVFIGHVKQGSDIEVFSLGHWGLHAESRTPLKPFNPDLRDDSTHSFPTIWTVDVGLIGDSNHGMSSL